MSESPTTTRGMRRLAAAMSIAVAAVAGAAGAAHAQPQQSETEPPAQNRTVEPAPVGAWRLDGDGADDARRLGAFEIPGGVDWTDTAAPAPYGDALEFDPGACYASADGEAMRTDTAFFASAWVRIDSKTDDQVFVSKTGRHRSAFALGYDEGTDRLTMRVTDRDAADGSQSAELASTVAPVAGEWTHVLATVSSGTVMLFVDGELDGELDTGLRLDDFTGPVHLGCDPGGGEAAFDGALTHVALWQGWIRQYELEAAYRGDLVPGTAAEWELRGDGADASGQDRALSLPDPASWGADQYGRADSAATFDGSECASVSDSVVHSRGDLTVEAWVKLDSTDRDQTIVAQATRHKTAFSLGYDAAAEAWRMAVPKSNGADPTTAAVHSSGGPEAGEWTHLAATLATDRDRAGTLALHVDGVHQGTIELGFVPMEGKPLVTVGCASDSRGDRDGHLDGAVSDVRLWRGALEAEAVAEAFADTPEPLLAAGWDFDFFEIYPRRGSPELTMHGVEGVDWEWADVDAPLFYEAPRFLGDSDGFASTEVPAVVTDESFTVMTWVNLSSKGTDQALVAQAGADGAGFELGYDAEADRYHFTMPSSDGEQARVYSQTVPQTDCWEHVTGVFDLASGELRLYVGSEPDAVAAGPAGPQRAEGPLTLAVAGSTAGERWRPLEGMLGSPDLFSSFFSDQRLRDIVPRSFDC